MNRRSLLTAGGAGLLGATLGGCAPRGARSDAWPRPRPAHDLVPVDASWARVIRTTVGLRPYRPSGFVLRVERLDEKTLIHNYGHGGAGHSLGWGTGYLAAELALEHTDRTAAVIGCGTVGLTSARQLQRRGFAVTIYTAAVPPDTTSNLALAGFTPQSGLVELPRRTPSWDAQFRRAAEIGYAQLQLLVGRDFGVSWIDTFSLADAPPAAGGQDADPPLLPPHLRTGREVLAPGEHPFPARYAVRRPSLRIEPAVYLDALVRDVLAFGGRIVIRSFDGPEDLAALPEPIIVNCTGLGARALAGDPELEPVRGQLTMLVPQPEVRYATFGGIPGPEGADVDFPIHMMPRRDGIALGGTSERGVWDREPDEDARRRIVEAHIALFGAMRRPRVKA